jgi:hypothetical protein
MNLQQPLVFRGLRQSRGRGAFGYDAEVGGAHFFVGCQVQRLEGYTASNDPDFAAKAEHSVGNSYNSRAEMTSRFRVSLTNQGVTQQPNDWYESCCIYDKARQAFQSDQCPVRRSFDS